MLEQAEGEAAWLLRDFDLRRPPGARAIVARHLGEGAIVTLPGMRGRDAQMIPSLHGKPAICIRSTLPRAAFRWAVLHELAEWHLQRIGYRGENVEQMAELVTACLVVPRAAFTARLRELGERWDQLAIGFDTSQTCVALRFLEVRDVPGAVDAPTQIRARGPARGWQSDETIRRLVRTEALPIGLRKTRLTDDRRRVLLIDEVEDVS